MMAAKFYRQFQKVATFTKEELAAYQLKHLQRIVAYAYHHVPWYKKAYSAFGFQPEDLKTFDDFYKLPYLTKEIIRDGTPDMFLSDEAEKLGVAFLKTSGTSGVPVQYGFGLGGRAAAYAVTMKAFSEAGYRIGSGQLLIKESHYSNLPFYTNRFTNRVAVNAYMLSKANILECEKVLRKKTIRHIWAHPNALLQFASSLKDPHGTFRHLRGATVMSEPLTDSLRRQIEDAIGTKVYNWYGNKEGTVAGYETNHDGFVLAEWFAFDEIIPKDDDPFHGEMVGTSFFNLAMPLIRYRMADIVKLKERPAESRRGGRQIIEVLGRTCEAILLPDGNKVRIFNLSKSNLDNVKMFQIIQTALRQIYIDVIPMDSKAPIDMASMKRELSRYAGNAVNIEVRIVDHLRMTKAGKTPRVVSEISNAH